jgi:hypothetical protein
MKKGAPTTKRAHYFRRINKTDELDVKKNPVISDVDPADSHLFARQYERWCTEE